VAKSVKLAELARSREISKWTENTQEIDNEERSRTNTPTRATIHTRYCHIKDRLITFVIFLFPHVCVFRSPSPATRSVTSIPASESKIDVYDRLYQRGRYYSESRRSQSPATRHLEVTKCAFKVALCFTQFCVVFIQIAISLPSYFTTFN
jgi:hypothetical protein